MREETIATQFYNWKSKRNCGTIEPLKRSGVESTLFLQIGVRMGLKTG